MPVGPPAAASAAALSQAVPALLATIGGAAARRRLHALHPARPGQEAAVTGFALALTLSLQRSHDAPVLWVQDRQARSEAGRPYGHGLAALGLDPARLVVVAVTGAMAVLAAAEMGLEETGLAGVLVDLPPRLPSDMLRLGKRLSLRAEARETPCFLLHAGGEPIEAPVATRWSVTSGRRREVLDSLDISRSVARPLPDLTTAFDLRLTKNRFGGLGRFNVAWRPVASIASSDEFNHARFAASRFTFPHFTFTHFTFTDTPLSEPVATTAANGSARTTRESGTLLPWPAAA